MLVINIKSSAKFLFVVVVAMEPNTMYERYAHYARHTIVFAGILYITAIVTPVMSSQTTIPSITLEAIVFLSYLFVCSYAGMLAAHMQLLSDNYKDEYLVVGCVANVIAPFMFLLLATVVAGNVFNLEVSRVIGNAMFFATCVATVVQVWDTCVVLMRRGTPTNQKQENTTALAASTTNVPTVAAAAAAAATVTPMPIIDPAESATSTSNKPQSISA